MSIRIGRSGQVYSDSNLAPYREVLQCSIMEKARSGETLNSDFDLSSITSKRQILYQVVCQNTSLKQLIIMTALEYGPIWFFVDDFW